MTGIEEFQQPLDRPQHQRRERPHRAQRADEEDAEYKLAIEASKYQEEEDRKKRQSRNGEPDDEDLAKALRLSREEEELRRRELEDQNASSLFDDDPIQVATQPTGFNQGYQQQPAVDWSGNPVNQMQQQSTGYMDNSMYGQQTGFQQQQTGYQNGYQNGFAPQPTGFDPYGAQQQQQQQFQPQPTGYNPYALSPGGFQQQPQQPEPLIPANTNNPWATNNSSPQALKPTPTGSNNPFAQSFTRPSSTPTKPTLATLQEQKTATNFSNNPSFNPNPNPIQSYTAPSPYQAPASQKPENPHEARLNALLASGDGMDTFGNTGNLRIPAQHTAPGTFVNSAGAGLGRIHEQQTGHNPFLQNQYTGMPATSYGANGANGQNGGFTGHQVPAATGPAGLYGAQSANPFGPRGQQQGQGGDLIQF